MTIQQIYDLALEMGMKADPRGYDAVKKVLEKQKKAHKELSEKRKKYFDLETLTNPYSDTRLLYGDPKTPVKKIFAGIDADAPEVLLADRLNQKGRGIDLIIGHHPEGHAYADLHDVMDLQVAVYADAGIPINVADALMKDRMSEIKRRIHPANHMEVVDTARLLEIPYMALHTVWDNMGDQFMKNYLKGKDFETVGEIVDYLMELPEYQEAERGKAGPYVVSGSEKSKAGRIVLFFTGGTNPPKEMYMEMAKAGIGTIIDMHMPEDAIKEMRKLHINVINAGHMSSDSIGANIFFDELEKSGVEVIPCSGFIRVKRAHSTSSGQKGKK
jgi:putative NIF3 family GTP cyclohydrolase 1 type 2